MPEESIGVPPSADSGNIPAEAPSVELKVETPENPAAPAEMNTPAKPAEPELFELPDGRKVDATTLTKEWKENFLPDYTRKSQDLARVKETINPLPKTEPTNPLADPNYTPGSYQELAEKIQANWEAKQEARHQATLDHQKSLEDAVVNQLAEVKKIDANFNQDSLFLHATKYGFRDLVAAHRNMKDMSELAKKVQSTTAANIAKRTDPVSSTPGATGARPNPGNFGSAVDYLRSLK